MSHDPYFHEASGSVRFWVPHGATGTGAMIGKETLSYSFLGHMSHEDPLKLYATHRDQIHEAVRKRVAAGAREPVMLRQADLDSTPPR